jgi:hypothetical protein
MSTRGFIQWSRAPRLANCTISLSAGPLTEYHGYLPLNARQIFYRLVGLAGYD